MTYTQLRKYLSTVARCGDEGAPTSVFAVGRWLELRDGGFVEYHRNDRWTVTRRGLTILSHKAPRRPYARPWHRDQHQQARSA